MAEVALKALQRLLDCDMDDEPMERCLVEWDTEFVKVWIGQERGVGMTRFMILMLLEALCTAVIAI